MNQNHIEPLVPSCYYDYNFDKYAVKKSPGEYHVTSQNILLATVLSLSVAACIRNTKAGTIGINYFMLPETSSANDLNNSSVQYDSYTIELLIRRLKAAHSTTIINREKEYDSKLNNTANLGHIELLD